jgi:hypothetical protein
MRTVVRESLELEMALVRRSVGALAAGRTRCDGCRRTPLIGEHVHSYESGRMLCELCRPLRADPPISTHLVHGPEFGHAVRITDNRAAA